MSSSNKKQACDRCHKLKQVCKGLNPCENCLKMGNVCTFVRPKIKMGRPKSESSKVEKHSKIEKRRGYSHNGCANCKQRKKKCDENWPICGNCKRLKLECPGGSNSTCQSNSSTDKQEDPNPVELSLNDYDIDILNPSDLSALFPQDQTKYPTNGLSPFYSPDFQFTFNNKERMFLNSLIKPQNSIADISGKYVEEPPNPSTKSSEQSEFYENETQHLISTCTLDIYRVSKKEIDLLHYFITDVSPVLFVDKTTTKFLRTVVPLCLEDQRVRYPILGIAASHRASRIVGVNLEFYREKVFFRAKAQSSFIDENLDYYTDTESILLGILLLAVEDIFEGDSLYWSIALERAGSLIKARGGLKKISKLAPLSIQLFCYLDLISSLSTCSTPFVEQIEDDQNLLNYDEDYIENLLNSKFGFKFGIAGEIFKIIGYISTLASLRSNRHTDTFNDQQFNTLANLIEMKLQKWSPPLEGIMNKYKIDEDSSTLTLSSYALALQWSAFLRLHQIRHGYNRKDSRVKACLSIIIRSMKVIGENTDLETGLMFPLIMSGSVAYENDVREYILKRLRNIKERLKFNYINEFEKLLIQVWSSDEGDSVNWAKIRFFQFPGLVMF